MLVQPADTAPSSAAPATAAAAPLSAPALRAPVYVQRQASLTADQQRTRPSLIRSLPVRRSLCSHTVGAERTTRPTRRRSRHRRACSSFRCVLRAHKRWVRRRVAAHCGRSLAVPLVWRTRHRTRRIGQPVLWRPRAARGKPTARSRRRGAAAAAAHAADAAVAAVTAACAAAASAGGPLHSAVVPQRRQRPVSRVADRDGVRRRLVLGRRALRRAVAALPGAKSNAAIVADAAAASAANGVPVSVSNAWTSVAVGSTLSPNPIMQLNKVIGRVPGVVPFARSRSGCRARTLRTRQRVVRAQLLLTARGSSRRRGRGRCRGQQQRRPQRVQRMPLARRPLPVRRPHVCGGRRRRRR